MNGELKIILTGASGMVGEGVLQECLQHPKVSEVLVIGRRSCGVNHPKLKEIIHENFYDLTAVEQDLKGYNTCLFCLGVSSIGMNEEEFTKKTYMLTMYFAETLSKINNNMTFCYISGKGTDSSEVGKIMWARVKGKTENDLKKLTFKAVYNFRPGALIASKGAKNTPKLYKYLSWLIPVVKIIAPNSICSIRQLGLAMINVCLSGFKTSTVEVKDIIELSKK